MQDRSIFSEIIHDRLKLKSLITLGVYVGLMIVSAVIFTKYVDKDSLQAIVASSGQWGIVIYLLIEIFYVTFTPLLNTFVLVTSGYIFGGHAGFAINFFANIIGSLLIVFLVQRYGRPLLKRVVSSYFYEKFDRITQKVGPMILMIIYVLPFTPDDELTYLVAVGPINIRRFILPIFIGNLGKAAYSYIGDLGSQGITIAFYVRVVALISGVIFVGLQEYIFKNQKLSQS
jgi:uncharacterized membrane protein YdjX (TVP38/TMEM64 family)